MIYIMPSLAHFQGWTLEGETLLYISFVSLQFEEKEDQGFAVIFGILMDSCVDGVFLNVIVSVLCDSSTLFPSSY